MSQNLDNYNIMNSEIKDNLTLNINESNPTNNTSIQLTSFKVFLDSISPRFLIICILVLFIILFITIIIICILLINKRREIFQTETIVNNNKFDINKMILQNSNDIKPNLKDFQSLHNNSNVSDCISGNHNMSLSEIKAHNLKEEIHNIVSGTLTKMSINKKFKKRKGNTSSVTGPKFIKEDNLNNNILIDKENNINKNNGNII